MQEEIIAMSKKELTRVEIMECLKAGRMRQKEAGKVLRSQRVKLDG